MRTYTLGEMYKDIFIKNVFIVFITTINISFEPAKDFPHVLPQSIIHLPRRINLRQVLIGSIERVYTFGELYREMLNAVLCPSRLCMLLNL